DTLNDNERINSIIRFELVKEYLEKAQVIVKNGSIQDRDEHVLKIKRSQELNPKEKNFCLEYLRELIVEMNYSQRTQITKDPRSDKYFVKAYTYEMKIVKKINRCLRCNSKQSDDEHCCCVVLYLLNNLKPSGYEFIDKFLPNYYMNQDLRSSNSKQIIRTGPKIFALKLINELNEQDNKVLEEVISHILFSSQGSRGVK
ncbi:17733_t:CDS:2, partial [Gigaspora rosea]